jgi:hypothetical protein
MNARQSIGLLLVVLGAIFFLLAPEFITYHYLKEIDVHNDYIYSFPYAGFALPSAITGIVLLVVGIIFIVRFFS